jgi:hypothetical protein
MALQDPGSIKVAIRDDAREQRRKQTVRALCAELQKIATPPELADAFRAALGDYMDDDEIMDITEPPDQEVIMATEDNKTGAIRSGASRSAKAAKLGLTMYGADKLGKGAMAIAKQPFEAGSKTREFLETDEGRHAVLGLMAFLANIGAEMDSVPIEADNIEWITEAVIANSVIGVTGSVADASVEKIMAAGMKLFAFAQTLRQPESMADVIEMARQLETEDTTLGDFSKVEKDADVEAKQEVS